MGTTLEVNRRQLLVAGTAGIVGLAVRRPLSAVADEASDGLVDQGVGMYTDLSVANQISSFTINPTMVSCGVGTLAHGSSSGPFAMLMYSLHHDQYGIDRANGVVTVNGRMRSITRVAGSTVEDVQHHFLAVAQVKGPDGPRFDVHFVTPFWNQSNPMSTHSTAVQGAVRFGGRLLLGEIVVGS
jgi:hypothetical protein